MKLDYKKTFLIGFGFLATSVAWAMYNAYVPLLIDEHHIRAYGAAASGTLIGTIMTFDNIFGVIFQPLFGALSDKAKTPIGRRMPFIVVGAPVCALAFALIPVMPTLPTMMAAIVIFTFVMSLWRAPVIALMPDITPSALRSKANGVINFMGGVGSLIAFVGGGYLVKLGDTVPFLTGSVVMTLSVLLLFLFIKEPREAEAIIRQEEEQMKGHPDSLSPDEKKKVNRSLVLILFAIFFWFSGYNAVESFFSSYAVNHIGVDKSGATFLLAFFSVTFIAMSIPAGILASKIGRRRTILTGLAFLMLLFPTMYFVKNLSVLRIMLLVGGAFWAFVNINSLPMVVELARHADIGRYTGYYYFFSFSAAIVAPIGFGRIADWFAVEKAGQIVPNYGLVFLFAAAAFLCAFLCMLSVRHGEAYSPTQSSGVRGD